MGFVVYIRNAVCHLMGNRAFGLEWGTQREAVDSESRLGSGLGQVWRKLVANVKDSDHVLEAVRSHGRLLRRGWPPCALQAGEAV